MKKKIKMPSLSVVIPAFNEHRTIEKVFDRVYDNELVSEIILVDDCSSDGTSKIIDRIPKKILNKKNITIKIHKNEIRVNLINTGINTMTGGRIKRLSRYISDERFMLTYGDGLSNVNLSELEKFHIEHKKLATITAVQPPARFGGLLLNGNKVLSFREKSKLDQSWINGGFFIFESKFIEFIKNDETFLEREPLENVASKDQLRAYKHEGFWQCMDTKRDLDYMQEIYAKGKIDVFYR